MTEYTAKEIQVLEGLEGVRRRPGMYIGDTSKRGFHHLIYEIIDNSIDEALAGHCSEIELVLKVDGSAKIRDNGRGIPVDMHVSGKSALEVVASSLHAGGKFGKKAYAVSGGLHGVGMSVVNALSEWMKIEVHRSGKIHSIGFSRGKLVQPITSGQESGWHGTVVHFKPDSEIFEKTEFDYDYLKERLMELAFLNKGLKIIINDERTGKKEAFFFEGGIREFVEHLNKSRNKLHQSFYFEKKSDQADLEVAIQYTDSYNSMIYSFVNNIKTIEGGTHLTGFRTALTRVINDYVKSGRIVKEEKKITGDDVLEGLTAVVSVRVQEPQFEGQTKTKLGNSEVRGAVDSVVYEAFKTYLEEHPADGKAIAGKIVNSMEAREAAQKAKDLIRRKNVFESSLLPGKLADCSEQDPSKAELYLVEGDSAGGSSKQARDRRFQAILPLRGKILNVEKAPMHKVLTSEEIKNMVLSIGGGFKDEFDVSKVRYHKIVIMTDADVDGSHIRTLILTLFYRYFRKIIDNGYLYIAQPPLYRVAKGKSVEYAYNEAQLDEVVKRMGGSVNLQRYKGLGEMNPKQLWDTTMDPETRTLQQVTVQDAIVADELFSILMGDAVEPRREFIEKNAVYVKNLDV
ncbi:DNA topoisomerase (ATP-hydrolyzing) subunit B [Candidatus Micrarchaeota archaeon]|nr:DNA topoisomerase (ATP-hydrolyzing) subunit B [Candidatus Micrarchaeota archaeon]